jgi:hypothetical protein
MEYTGIRVPSYDGGEVGLFWTLPWACPQCCDARWGWIARQEAHQCEYSLIVWRNSNGFEMLQVEYDTPDAAIREIARTCLPLE